LAAVVPPPRKFDPYEALARGMVTDAEMELDRYPYQGTIHDLFATLRDPDGRIAGVLAGHGVTAEQVRGAARRLADADGASEGGTYAPEDQRSIGEWIALFGSGDPETRSDSGLRILSWALTLEEPGRATTLAAYASRVVPVMTAALVDACEEVRFAA